MAVKKAAPAKKAASKKAAAPPPPVQKVPAKKVPAKKAAPRRVPAPKVEVQRSSVPATAPPVSDAIRRVAKELNQGQWGGPIGRDDRLRAAGHDPDLVNQEVERQLSSK